MGRRLRRNVWGWGPAVGGWCYLAEANWSMRSSQPLAVDVVSRFKQFVETDKVEMSPRD